MTDQLPASVRQAKRATSLHAAHVVPALLAAAGERASLRFMEFFAANIRNPHTRRAYARAVTEFLTWCDDAGVVSVAAIQPLHVAAWIEQQTREHAAPTVKAQLAAIRHLFDWLVIGQVMPCHHNLETYLHAYIEGAGLAEDPKGPLFRTISRGTSLLTRTPLPQPNAYLMIGRAAAAGIATKLGNHSFRATGITAYLKNDGTLEKAAQMANHASTRTTQLYDRRREELSLDEVESIRV
jgi:site-specific recombinase XerD